MRTWVALDCAVGLARESRETHGMLLKLLDDPHHRMREWVATACGTYAVRSAKKRLEDMQRHDPHGGVKHAAKKAIEKL